MPISKKKQAQELRDIEKVAEALKFRLNALIGADVPIEELESMSRKCGEVENDARAGRRRIAGTE